MQYVESCGGLRGSTPHKYKCEMERKTHSPTISEKKKIRIKREKCKKPPYEKKRKEKRKYKYPACTLEFG